MVDSARPLSPERSLISFVAAKLPATSTDLYVACEPGGPLLKLSPCVPTECVPVTIRVTVTRLLADLASQD